MKLKISERYCLFLSFENLSTDRFLSFFDAFLKFDLHSVRFLNFHKNSALFLIRPFYNRILRVSDVKISMKPFIFVLDELAHCAVKNICVQRQKNLEAIPRAKPKHARTWHSSYEKVNRFNNLPDSGRLLRCYRHSKKPLDSQSNCMNHK